MVNPQTQHHDRQHDSDPNPNCFQNPVTCELLAEHNGHSFDNELQETHEQLPALLAVQEVLPSVDTPLDPVHDQQNDKLYEDQKGTQWVNHESNGVVPRYPFELLVILNICDRFMVLFLKKMVVLSQQIHFVREGVKLVFG